METNLMQKKLKEQGIVGEWIIQMYLPKEKNSDRLKSITNNN